jgi:hypothetical protein
MARQAGLTGFFLSFYPLKNKFTKFLGEIIGRYVPAENNTRKADLFNTA